MLLTLSQNRLVASQVFTCLAAGSGLPPNAEGEEVRLPTSQDGAGGRLLHHPHHLCHGSC